MISTCLPPSSIVAEVDTKSDARTDPVASTAPLTAKVDPTETELDVVLMLDRVTSLILAEGDVMPLAVTVLADNVDDTVASSTLSVSELTMFDARLTPPITPLFALEQMD